MRFFINSKSSSYLRNLENEFSESTNSIRQELNRFEKAGFLDSYSAGNKKMFKANTNHPLYTDIRNLMLKHIGFDQIIDKVANRLGELNMVYVVGDFAKGIDNKIIDLIFIGDNLDKEYLLRLVEKAEKLISRKIRYIIYNIKDFKEYSVDLKESETLLLWKEK